MSDVTQFYKGRSVFITGATGFIGKVLIEKLLYSCKDLKQIFILIRNKESRNDAKKKCYTRRFSELLQSKAFDRVRYECSDALSKIIPVYGHLSEPGLGLSKEDETVLVENVTIFYHCAAIVKFNEPLKDAMTTNVLGTKNVFEVYKKCQNPEAFIYLSTAYSNCHRSFIEEKVYPPSVPLEFLFKANQELSTKSFQCLTDPLLEGRPNTYTLTKSLAESYLDENSDGFTVAIVRPSVVFHSKEDPIKGWGDSFSLYASIAHFVASGLVHNIPTDGKAKCQAIPVDFVSNVMIVLAWSITLKNCFSERLPVLNCVANLEKSCTHEEYTCLGVKHAKENPSNVMVNYPFLSMTRNPIKFNYGKIVNHYIPAMILDLIRLTKGKSPRYFNLYRRFFNYILPMESFFINKVFNFETRNTSRLYEKLSSMDQNLFNFNEDTIEWKEFLGNMFHGMRNYIVPHEYTNPEAAKKSLNRLYWQSVGYSGIIAIAFAVILFYVFSFIISFY